MILVTLVTIFGIRALARRSQISRERRQQEQEHNINGGAGRRGLLSSSSGLLTGEMFELIPTTRARRSQDGGEFHPLPVYVPQLPPYDEDGCCTQNPRNVSSASTPENRGRASSEEVEESSWMVSR
jgi:hypothetical protein